MAEHGACIWLHQSQGLGYLMSGGAAAPINTSAYLGHSGLKAMDQTRTGPLSLELHTPLCA